MDLESRIRLLEAREAIKELRAEYCYRIDDRDWDGFTELFTEDAHLDFGPIGTFDGHAAIREFAEHIVGERQPFLSHMLHNPQLEINEETATGRWYFEVPCTFDDGDAGWIQGRYRDAYARPAERWLFSSVTARFNYIARYDDGWADIVTE